MAVTNNIREIREQRGIYQDDLAAAIGYSTKTVGRIERGDSTPSAEFMLLPDNVCVWVEGIALWSVCGSPPGEGRPSVLPLLPESRPIPP